MREIAGIDHVTVPFGNEAGRMRERGGGSERAGVAR